MHRSYGKNRFGLVDLLLVLCGTIIIWKAKCLHAIAVSDFNVNDIFNNNLMPMEIFSKHYVQDFLRDMPRNTSSSLQLPAGVNTSDFSAALNEMRFHREKINEFLATDYVVQSMLLEWNEKVPKGVPIGKRMGALLNDSLGPQPIHRNHKLLNDEGMTKYRSWIERSITLDDIRRHLPSNNYLKGIAAGTSNLGGNRRQTFNVESAVEGNNDEEDFEDGDITGYAVTNNPYNIQSDNNAQFWPFSPMPSVMIPTPSDGLINNPLVRAINKNGYDSGGYDDYGAHAPVHTPHPPPVDVEPQKKEISIKDITDIALTTLAFLSFGMFVLQILMCITMGKDDSSSVTMLPMEMNDTDLPGDGTEEIRRKRRSTLDQSDRLNKMNELARRVLFSIDSVLAMPQDGGSCHYWALCENNKFAKSQMNGQKFWIPIWSIGVSWLTSRVQEAPTQNDGNYGAVLKSLKAIVIGVSSGDCGRIYKTACDNPSKTWKKNFKSSKGE